MLVREGGREWIDPGRDVRTAEGKEEGGLGCGLC